VEKNMSNLLNTADGRNALLIAQKYLLERRISRFFKRNLVIDVEKYRTGSDFDIETMLGDLNVAHDPEILLLYQLLGAVGGLSQTYSDITYHVNPTTGSDVTGLGTLAKPYASTWFLDNLPRRIAHKVKILIYGDLTENKDVYFDFDFITRDAAFSVVGVGSPTVILDDQPVDAIGETPLRPQGGSWLDILTIPAVNQNRFLQAKDGAAALRAAPIYASVVGTGVITRTTIFQGAAAGDLYRVIEPSITWTVRSLHSFCRGEVHRSNFSNRGAPLAMMNLNIAFTTEVFPLPNQRNFSWKNDCASMLSFVWFKISVWNVLFEHGEINTLNAVDPDLELLSLSTVANLNNGLAGLTPIVCGFVLGENASSSLDVTVKDTTIRGLCTKQGVQLTGGFSKVEQGWAYLYRAYNTQAYVYFCIATGESGIANDAGACIECQSARVQIDRFCGIDSDNVVAVRGNSDVLIRETGSDATFSVIAAAGLWTYGLNHVQIISSAAAAHVPSADGLTGPDGDSQAYQESIGLTAVAFAAADVVVNVGNTPVLTL
jgi:hypothetical protein